MSEAAKILREAQAVDREIHGANQQAKPGAQQAQEQTTIDPTLDPGAEWAFIPKMVGGILSMAMPELSNVYNDQACLDWGKAFHSVAQKHNWNVGMVGPEIALAIASMQFAVPTYIAIASRRKKPKEQPITEQATEATTDGDK